MDDSLIRQENASAFDSQGGLPVISLTSLKGKKLDVIPKYRVKEIAGKSRWVWTIKGEALLWKLVNAF